MLPGVCVPAFKTACMCTASRQRPASRGGGSGGCLKGEGASMGRSLFQQRRQHVRGEAGGVSGGGLRGAGHHAGQHRHARLKHIGHALAGRPLDRARGGRQSQPLLLGVLQRARRNSNSNCALCASLELTGGLRRARMDGIACSLKIGSACALQSGRAAALYPCIVPVMYLAPCQSSAAALALQQVI